MSKVSYCDDCIHKMVCKYVKQVEEYEAKAPEQFTVIGPVLKYSISCQYKISERSQKV